MYSACHYGQELIQVSRHLDTNNTANEDGGGESLISEDFGIGSIELSAPAHETRAALAHLTMFLGFIDKYLHRQVKLYEDLRARRPERVAFENLWMLFDEGDTILCPLRNMTDLPEYHPDDDLEPHRPVARFAPQAYRVTATTAGMPRGKNSGPNYKIADTITSGPAPASTADVSSGRVKSNFTEFYIYCFFVDFNGSEYKVISEIFVIRPFEREMDIRSLQVYPTGYHDARDSLITRGLSFMDVTNVSHMQYEGLSLGDIREEINSPVVVDIKFAYEDNSDPGKAAIQKPAVSFGPPIWIPAPPYECFNMLGATSCGNLWCHDKDCSYVNNYTSYQRRRQEKNENNIKGVLDEYEIEKQNVSKGVERFRRLMEKNDLVLLLPGVVPAYALRNRKWGECKSKGRCQRDQRPPLLTVTPFKFSWISTS